MKTAAPRQDQAVSATFYYDALREEIEIILSEGKLQSRQATEWEKVQTYWNVGKQPPPCPRSGGERAGPTRCPNNR